MRVGFVGLGNIGAPMLQCLVDAGHELAVHDPDPAAVEPFRSTTVICDSNREVAARSEAVHVVVNDEAQVMTALLDDDGLVPGAAPGTVIVLHSTIAHDTLRSVVDAAEAADVHVLDAGISGAMGQFSIPELTVMVGGDAGAFGRVEPLLRTFGGLVLHLGPSGAGLDAKLALNVTRYLWYLASLEGIRLAEEVGIERSTMWEIFRCTGLTSQLGGAASSPRVPPGQLLWPAAEKMSTVAEKDLRAALARAAEVELSLPLATEGLGLMRAMFGVDRDVYG